MQSEFIRIVLVYEVKSGPSPPTGNPQPTKQSIPTIPSNMTGIKTINDALMITPALPTPMTCCRWISPIHHQYHLASGISENWRKREVEAISVFSSVGFLTHMYWSMATTFARSKCTNYPCIKASLIDMRPTRRTEVRLQSAWRTSTSLAGFRAADAVIG
jgi:hypothetical protein